MSSPRSRRLLIGGLVAVLALALVAGPAAAKSPQQSSSETDTVRLGVFANVTHAPGLVAIESGLLQEELGPDVKLEVQYFNAGPTVITALLAGAIDVSYIGPNPAITGFARVGWRGVAHHLRFHLGRRRARGEARDHQGLAAEGQEDRDARNSATPRTSRRVPTSRRRACRPTSPAVATCRSCPRRTPPPSSRSSKASSTARGCPSPGTAAWSTKQERRCSSTRRRCGRTASS